MISDCAICDKQAHCSQTPERYMVCRECFNNHQLARQNQVAAASVVTPEEISFILQDGI